MPPWTSTETDAVVVNFCADFVPVTEAVLFSDVPFEAVTCPRMVTVRGAADRSDRCR